MNLNMKKYKSKDTYAYMQMEYLNCILPSKFLKNASDIISLKSLKGN